MPIDRARLAESLRNGAAVLLQERNAEGYWEGQLSSSALSTATAVCALAVVNRNDTSHIYSSTPFTALIDHGLTWLANHQNRDGGWGDTILSESNISTTVLSWAVFAFADRTKTQFQSTLSFAEDWIRAYAGGIEPHQIAQTILSRYGKDRTFSVPILTHCVLAGRLGTGKEAWSWVKQLPFELAACPHHWFAALRLPVVSYALPALIAMGYVRHFYYPTRNPLMRWIRSAARNRTLKILEEIQPAGGGYLEAIPLTSFVAMSLAASGAIDHPVVHNALRFIVASVQADGSWAIDTNLATWVTTLSVNALSRHPDYETLVPENERSRILHFLLNQQYKNEHPYTHAAPGGWAWTHLPGGVPDADDTSGALLALSHVKDSGDQILQAARAGIEWLVNLQNRDGGVPTFCRGWSNLPFDRSCPDITAHAIQSMSLWKNAVDPAWKGRIHRFEQRALRYVIETQQSDGSWHPLWFGNERENNHFNKTYGTAQVLIALGRLDREWFSSKIEKAIQSGAGYLLHSQNQDGGWGGAMQLPATIEETALATLALASLYRKLFTNGNFSQLEDRQKLYNASIRGASWLIERTNLGRRFAPAAIGFYFAELWYYEKLYPIIFTLAALCEVVKMIEIRL
ncbi:MAG: squalene--hopene cyclase [Candidatus Omnitrophota bacterium]|jgi:squalene-hopene/tetraprenyl-beta-curcumene cyclase|nr:MAG: squalene--hopene cyclase [Candidatus Omnitrophota bacterium]